MEILRNVLLVVHVIIAIILTIIVLMQSGKSAGLSGTIAGGAETFFGKNKGRTLDAILGKWTVFAAVMFLITSIGLTVTINSISKKQEEELQAAIQAAQQVTEGEVTIPEEGEVTTPEDLATPEEGEVTTPEEGDVVDTTPAE